MKSFTFGSILMLSVLSVLLTAASISLVLGTGIYDIYSKVLPITVVILGIVFSASFVLFKRSKTEMRESSADFDLQKKYGEDISSELKPFLNQLEEQERLRREMYSDISHEMKTPLTTIQGYAELMENGMVPAEDVPDIAGKMSNESKYLLGMIERVLESSRKKEVRPVFDEMDMYAAAKVVAERLNDFAEQKHISVSVEGRPTVLFSDRELYEQICYNLIENAIKYTRENGTIRVAVLEERDRKILLVSDNGIGISEEDQMRVFERFFRGDPSHSREVKGNGLGLSIVKHHSENLGAEVVLSSQLGVGTEVKVIFR